MEYITHLNANTSDPINYVVYCNELSELMNQYCYVN